MPVSFSLFLAGVVLILLAAVPYVVYLFGMTFGKKVEPLDRNAAAERIHAREKADAMAVEVNDRMHRCKAV